METAIARELATHNPAKQSRALRETDSTERAPFTVEEVRKMIDHEKTSAEWKGAILIAAHTGLRLGDVLGLGRKHVSGSRLVIQPAKTARLRKVIKVPLTPADFAKWRSSFSWPIRTARTTEESSAYPLPGTLSGMMSTSLRR